MMKRIRTKIIFISLIILISGTIFSPPDVSVFASPGRSVENLSIDPEFQPESGTYYYNVDWNKVNVGKARISVEQEMDQYKIAVHAETNKKIDYVYKIRYRGESKISDDPISPIKTKIREKINSTKKETTIDFQENGAIKSTETKSKKGKPAKETEREIQTENFTLDPFSATFLVRRLDWEVGMEEIFDVYTGKDQYLLELQCIRKTTIEIAGENREAWEIVPELTKLDKEGIDKKDQDNDDLKEDKKLNDMWIYVSADETKEMLKIKVSLKIGYFRIVLEKFEPAAEKAE